MRTIRQATKEDEAFIYATWLRSQYFGNTWFKQMEKDAFFDNYKNVVAARLASSLVLVSCLESDPEVVLGYAVYSPDKTTLHWIYVKRAWRQLGIARELAAPEITSVSSLTKIGKALMPKEWKFNPFK